MICKNVWNQHECKNYILQYTLNILHLFIMLGIFIWPIIIIQPFSSFSLIAPEVVGRQRYGRPVDCWAIGVIMYILWVHESTSIHLIHCIRQSNMLISLCSWTRPLFISRPHRYLFWSHLPDTSVESFMNSSACTSHSIPLSVRWSLPLCKCTVFPTSNSLPNIS